VPPRPSGITSSNAEEIATAVSASEARKKGNIDLVTAPEKAAGTVPTADDELVKKIKLDASDIPEANLMRLRDNGEGMIYEEQIDRDTAGFVRLMTIQVKHTDGTEKIYVFRYFSGPFAPFDPMPLPDYVEKGLEQRRDAAAIANWLWKTPQKLYNAWTAEPTWQYVAGPFDASIGHKAAAERVFAVYRDIANDHADALKTFSKMAPVIGTTLHFVDGEWGDGVISLVGDLSLAGGPLAKALSASKVAKVAVVGNLIRKTLVTAELAVAGVRGIQGVLVADEDPVRAGAYILEALLRVYGAKMLAKTRSTPIENLPFGKDLKVGEYTTTIKWGIRDVKARPYGPGYWGERVKQVDASVDAFELKLNPANESFYLRHPDGGFVQFENLVGSQLQDAKLIMKVKSIYHVDDLPDFARAKVINEARRQVEAAAPNALQVQWLVSDDKALKQLAKLFNDEAINIKLIPFPD
jgi:hypothetical protein